MKLGNNTFLKNLKKDNLPENNILFWDTSLLVAAIIHHEQSDMRKAAIDFIDRLVKERTHVAFSSILIDEFIYVSTINELKKSQGTKSQAKKALERKDNLVIMPHIKDIENNMVALNNIISKFGTRLRLIIPNEAGIVTKALELQCKYRLDRADSIHIATMLFGSQRDIGCFDRHDFCKVDGINIWCKY
ncbi:MAG: hypothetical protein AUJ89_01045 [Candidatus Omnitrophica bacterium CG1_02_43_210]|nr:MAG: hypothetical protein AUJ89_01045 [Candidatus Omnitrophica bacterium CG1_02_43_210]PIV11789.1 MAG: hypothetical protein COS48_04135 [Candidatus Omnitrophica bacterium CG03_land_8_20_14_0_80_43_22]PJC46683.1 MAG: hypothetical protein CO036_01540 [Candidatus Omnitrophica bacterium CG_4_9_14_0_2_um_filter_43_12]